MKERKYYGRIFVIVTTCILVTGTVLSWENINDHKGIYGYLLAFWGGQYIYLRSKGKWAIIAVGVEAGNDYPKWRKITATLFAWVLVIWGVVTTYGYYEFIK
ncbi:hypothetical protein [Porticoccus hydrocarbonoclasticus]|uniref:hypothetical protein n=1 Tax=Porticoccus hydrocarbonoclasticus TaxID=1073414 RepID=UPI0023554CA2|nr:hypothetical protein [Porticoccus hydrocarbonoclasticus]